MIAIDKSRVDAPTTYRSHEVVNLPKYDKSSEFENNIAKLQYVNPSEVYISVRGPIVNHAVEKYC